MSTRVYFVSHCVFRSRSSNLYWNVLQRFSLTSQVISHFRHANIVRFLDCYLIEKELWIAMEFLEDGALTAVVTETVMDKGHIAAVSRSVWVKYHHCLSGLL